jgi:O6-methylguanine-DNA--protein-cysteine methyltransferase
MIDATNLFATQFYNEINGGNPVQPTGYSINLGVVSFGNNQVSKEPISNAIMGSLGLQTLYNVNNTNPNVLKGNHTWLIGWLGILLFLVTAFVMFSLAFILVARFVALIFLILLSPVGFMGLAIPQLKYRAGQWLSNFLEQIITAPVLLLLLYVALAVITDAKFLTGFNSSSAGWLALDSNNITGFAGILLSFLVAIGLLLVVVIKAKSMGAVGADWATKTAGKLTFGATALVGRTTVGWGGKKLANLSRRVGLARVPLVGTGITRGLDRVASGSFDVRGIAVGGGLAAVGAGTAQKGGYKADLKSRIESRTKYASELTGRELNDDEKIQLAIHQKVLAADEKQLSEKRAKQMRNKRDGVVDADLDRDIRKLEEDTKEGKKEVEKIENLTDKGAQRKYASWLELGQKPKGVFNTYFNFAANTEAAKAIRATAKKAKPDKDFTTNMKNLLKEAAKESGEETETGPTTPPAATPTTSAPATPPSGPTTAPGGGTPPAP